MLPKLLKSETVYRGRVIGLRVDEVEINRKRPARLEIVEHSGGVVILPLDQAGNIWFIRQYRHAASSVLLELPAGTLESNETPAAGADRELREEIGHRAGKLEEFQQFWLAPGYSTEYMHAFLATDLGPARLAPDDDERISIAIIPRARAVELALAADGELRDAKSILCVLAAARKYGW